MTISYRTGVDTAYLEVVGALDAATAPRLIEVATTALKNFIGVLKVDMAAVDFMDSTGVGALVTIRNTATEAGNTLVLENLQPRVLRVLDLVGLTAAFQAV
jgi:anti-sigma B factor antagonist